MSAVPFLGELEVDFGNVGGEDGGAGAVTDIDQLVIGKGALSATKQTIIWELGGRQKL